MDTIHWLVNHMVGLNSGISSLYQPVFHGLESEGARGDQINDVQNILREEMSRKLIRLLADILDQPGKLLSGLQMLIDAARNIHGLKADSIGRIVISEPSASHDPSNLLIKGQSSRVDQSSQDKSVDVEDARRADQNQNQHVHKAVPKEQDLSQLATAQSSQGNFRASSAQSIETNYKNNWNNANIESSGVNA